MGLIAEIFRSDSQDCSNNGISSRCTRVVIVNVPGPFEQSDEMPAVLMVEGNLRNTVKIIPCDPETTETFGHSMMGGTYVGTSDSRFSEAYAKITGEPFGCSIAPLHDRFE
jgi:hypothetical protein